MKLSNNTYQKMKETLIDLIHTFSNVLLSNVYITIIYYTIINPYIHGNN